MSVLIWESEFVRNSIERGLDFESCEADLLDLGSTPDRERLRVLKIIAATLFEHWDFLIDEKIIKPSIRDVMSVLKITR